MNEKKIKGIEKLNSIVEKFFIGLGYPEITCNLNVDFSYCPNLEEITYSLFEVPIEQEAFKTFLKKHYPKKPYCSIFTISLLHELGHHITYYNYNKRELFIQKIKKAQLNIKYKILAFLNVNNLFKWQIDYMNLKEEKTATDTAVKILEKHYNFIHNYEKTLQQAILNFYKENNVIIDK